MVDPPLAGLVPILRDYALAIGTDHGPGFFTTWARRMPRISLQDMRGNG
jgi:hypothetical protein